MKLTHEVEIGDGAVMTIINPQSFEDGGLEWIMRYGNPEAVRYIAASVLASYDYLLCGAITSAAAMSRLRKLRNAYAALAKEARP